MTRPPVASGAASDFPGVEPELSATTTPAPGKMAVSLPKTLRETAMRYDYEGKPFTAYDPDGRGYLVSPVYRFHDPGAEARRKTFDSRDCVGLLTEDGRWVRRDRPGRYAILGTAVAPEVALRSGAQDAI